MKILLISIVSMLSVQCKHVNNEDNNQASVVSEMQEPVIKVISKDMFKAAVSNKDVQLVDVRTPDEYSGGHIENALNINIYDQDFAQKISKLDKDKPVYIYCRSGARSQSAASQMKDLGFKSIIDLKGGYMNY